MVIDELMLTMVPWYVFFTFLGLLVVIAHELSRRRVGVHSLFSSLV